MTRAQLLKQRQGRVLLLSISDPDTYNALHPNIYGAGIETLATLDANIAAIVISGVGDNFCSGGNLKRLASNRLKPSQHQADNITNFHRWIVALHQCPCPTIAAVEGNAFGAGFSIALACDMIVAATDARFSMAYVRVGLSPDGGSTTFLSKIMPRQLVNELLLSGCTISSTRLHTLGIVNRVVANGQAQKEALSIANTLSQGPKDTQRAIKALLRGANDTPLLEQLEREKNSFLDRLFDHEAEEGINAFFQRRPAKFKDNIK